MPFDFGDVVLVAFPFTNQKTSKKRPAVVVSNRAYNAAKPDVIIMAITSRPFSSSLGEVSIADWPGANLLKPSVIKPVFATVELNLILSLLGTLSSQDQFALRSAIASVLG